MNKKTRVDIAFNKQKHQSRQKLHLIEESQATIQTDSDIEDFLSPETGKQAVQDITFPLMTTLEAARDENEIKLTTFPDELETKGFTH